MSNRRITPLRRNTTATHLLPIQVHASQALLLSKRDEVLAYIKGAIEDVIEVAGMFCAISTVKCPSVVCQGHLGLALQRSSGQRLALTDLPVRRLSGNSDRVATRRRRCIRIRMGWGLEKASVRDEAELFGRERPRYGMSSAKCGWRGPTGDCNTLRDDIRLRKRYRTR